MYGSHRLRRPAHGAGSSDGGAWGFPAGVVSVIGYILTGKPTRPNSSGPCMSQHPLRLLLDFDERIRHDKDQAPAFFHRRTRASPLDGPPEGPDPAPARGWGAWDRSGGPGALPTPDRK